MADLTDNQVLLRLVIKGMDPDEVSRLAAETYGQLKTEAAQHIDALTAYYKQANQAQTDDAKQAAQDKIDAETSALDAITKLMRQQEIEANKARGAWHGIMEDLENITTVATAAFKIMSDGFERLKGAAEEIVKDTNIYNSLTGSIEQMRVATDGAVSNIDLITTKNRAMEKDLNLTDQQFGVVAAAATHYAHAVGIDAKEALDKMVDGMATGRVKMLEHAGIVVDAAEANQKWADKMGVTVDSMTAQEKLIAFQTEALEKMKAKMEEVGFEPDTLAERFERGFVRIKNAITDAAAALGNLKLGDPVQETIDARAARDRQAAAAKKASEDDWAKQHADFQDTNSTKNPLTSGVQDQDSRQYNDENGKPVANQTADARLQMKFGDQKGAAAQAANAQAADSTMNKVFSSGQGPTVPEGLNPDEDLQTKAAMSEIDTSGLDDYVKAADAANAAAEKALVTQEKMKGVTVDTAVAYQKLADSMGLEVDQLDHEEKMTAIASEAKVQFDALQKKLKKEADQRRAELKTTKDKAGFLGIFLWGPDGPSETYKQMDKFQQEMTDMVGGLSSMLSGSAQAMAGAMGQSLAATIEGAAGHKKSMEQMVHDTLSALAAQALVKAVWNVAEGIGNLAMYNYPAAALNFAAAAAYGVVGVAAGLGARAMGPDPTTAAAGASGGGGSAATAPSSGTSSASSNMGASGSRSTANPAPTQGSPVTINMTVMPGGEAGAGRSIMKALTALQNQTGQSVQPLIAST